MQFSLQLMQFLFLKKVASGGRRLRLKQKKMSAAAKSCVTRPMVLAGYNYLSNFERNYWFNKQITF
jgi:hypothetical protein